MPVPPTPLRRLVVAPLVLLVELAFVLISPVSLVIGTLASLFTGGWRPVRMLAIAVTYAWRHIAATLACVGLWLGSGFGLRAGSPRMQRAYYALLRWFVGGIYRTVVGAARVEVRMTESEAAEAALTAGERPVVVLSIHAGHGDSFLVIWQLLCRWSRRPRIVMHERLQLDPLIDILGRRLPNRFVDPRGGDTEVEIAAMARELDPAGAVLIFPEGGNFSAARRQRSIERLERLGHDEEAATARAIRNLSAPRPGGALAAIEAAPGADVVFVGHTGFPATAREMWKQLPHEQTIEVQLWHVPCGDIPDGHDERIEWLFDWWRRLDGWVDERGAAHRSPGA
jgi:1-acyl-sn-glycerol-3-phosphate acyltransferase